MSQGRATVFGDGVAISSVSSSFAVTILTSMVFLGAFLLFSMEPLVGRLLVPFFGGAVHVWLICLMFFQAMLLAGYLYAHLFAQRLGAWHLLLLLVPLINLPLGVVAEPSPETPFLTLLGVLLAHFAVPFAVLATTAVVAQSWLANSSLGQSHEPYPLYAASNAGSLVALLGYPFLFEPLSGVRFQSLAWSGGYLLYCMLAVFAWFMMHPGNKALPLAPEQDEDITEAAPTTTLYVQWLLLSALPSAFLLTVTNFIALEVGSFPMIWVMPLALYLASFIVTFRNNGGIPKSLVGLWPYLLLASLVNYLIPLSLGGWGIFVLVPAIFFGICLIAHGALYERRPPVRHLTIFYLVIAAGGLIGGVAISIMAPMLLSGLYEYPITLGAFALVFAWILSPAALLFWRKTSSTVMHGGKLLLIILFLGVFIKCGVYYFSDNTLCKFRHRNFYGTYSVKDVPPSENNPDGIRQLVHGMTLHGAQLLTKEKESTPISYYYRGGPFADVYEAVPSPRRLAVVGLGAGVVSAFTQPGDSLTYYEIDPDNEGIARTWFSFLGTAQTPVSVIVGDARLSLQNETKDHKPFDIITIDAFTGDGIPTHLLTLEALEVYLSRLAPDGLLLFHISNRYYDLRPLMKAVGEQVKLHGVLNKPASADMLGKNDKAAQCVAFSRKAENLQPLRQRGWVSLAEAEGLEKTAAWTDDYINILSPLFSRLKVR